MIRRESNGGIGFALERMPEAHTLVVTGRWSWEANALLTGGDIDGLVLNYARGFEESDLEFLDSWPIRRLELLDRSQVDLEPLSRLDALEELSIQVAPNAHLDLSWFPRLRSVASDWTLLRETLVDAGEVHNLTTWRFDDPTLHVFEDHSSIQSLTVKDAPHLESLSGVEALRSLSVLRVIQARELHNLTDVIELSESLREVELESCPSIEDIQDLGCLINLRFLGISDCGRIDSLAPARALVELVGLHAWGSTRIIDADLSPLAELGHLTDLRMRDRREYRPPLAEILARLPKNSN
jgi:hypothetical protein